MDSIQNNWVEKLKKTKLIEKAPSYQASAEDSWLPTQFDKKGPRPITASNATMKKTLRGLRK
jgi:hypothetical protein